MITNPVCDGDAEGRCIWPPRERSFQMVKLYDDERIVSQDALKPMARARFVAEHWRASILAMQPSKGWEAHPLCMVLAALDGETDPVECGLSPDTHEAFRSLSAVESAPPDPA